MTAIDESNMYGAVVSGVIFEGDNVVWAVNNGNGTLHRLDLFTDRITDSVGWVGGKKLRSPDGKGTVDAEGVALVGGSSAQGVLVGSERNTGSDLPKGTRPSVLVYSVTGSNASTQELVASHE